jgi:hypothetical protein
MRRTFALTLLAAWAAVGPAPAMTITDLYGDRDGLGIGVLPDAAFDFTQVTREMDDQPLIDVWMSGTRQWSHAYDVSGLGPITSASFKISTGGQGWYGISRVYVDGLFVGNLSDGDGFDGNGLAQANFVRLDTFDLTPFAALLDGATIFTVETSRRGDWWALDYCELILSDDAPPPEPNRVPDSGGTAWLLGLGLVGLWRLNKTCTVAFSGCLAHQPASPRQ